MEKRIALILALVMVLSLAACGGSGGKSGNEGGGEEEGSAVGAGVSADTAVGDKITMGKLDGEALTWTAAGKGVGTILLVSDKVLMRRAFTGEDNNSATWKDSEIRAYLNGEFLDSVFTEEEKALIAPTELLTVAFDFDAYQNVNEYTTDSVFLLSGSEYARYVTPIKDFKFGIPTQALLDDNVYMADVEGSDTVTQACGWILRDNGSQEVYTVMDVYGFDGTVSTYGSDKTSKGGIRPAMWVYTDKALADGWKAGTASLPADEALDAKLAGLSVGSSVTFGTGVYADPNKGAMEIGWKVLDETEDAWLLYSDELLGAYRFGEEDDETLTWAASEARAYLNGDEYINDLFNPWEREKIRLSHITTCGGSDSWDVDPGPETDDYLFLLDREEMEKYYPNEADRVIADAIYWLRSPDFVRGWFSCVNEAGTIRENTAGHYYGLRVAMWVSK
ncbi:MAG: hypothetical protein IJK89_04430 [Clostridia bacterium]|nr:hypothetical protein [Clostridia bacterium]